MYTLPEVKSTVLKGQATVKTGSMKDKKVFGVTFSDKPDVTHTILAKNAPSYAVAGEFYVKLSSDKSKIESMSPQRGKFRVVVDSFPAREGEQPTPYTVVNQKYNSSSEKFNVLLKIVSEKYNGMPILLILPYYWFDEAEAEVGGVMRSVVGLKVPKKPSPGHKQLKAFLSASGALKFGHIKWSDNILPTLQKYILRAATEFVVRLENGFVDTIEWDDDDSQTDSDFVEQTPEPAKKVAKKPAVDDDVTDWGEPEEEITGNDVEDFENSPPWDDVEE